MRRLRPRTRAAVAAGVAVVIAATAHSASAAVVSQSGGVVTYQAATGEVNQPIPFIESGRLRVREANPATPLTAGVGCQIVSDRLADCGPAGSARVNLGDRDDTYFGTGAGFFAVTVNGEAGNDTFIDGDGATHAEIYIGGDGVDIAAYFLESRPVSLSLDNAANDGEAGEGDFIASDVENLQGGQASDTLTGNAASNDLRGEGGNDHELGLDGNDLFEEGKSANGADTMSGGAGTDRVLYRERTDGGVAVSLNGGADDGRGSEGDNVLTDVENITGSPFADTLLGDSAANTLAALGGDDSITGGTGSDTIFGGDGNDSINARDGVADNVNCNSGSDFASLDLPDSRPSDCESVSQFAVDEKPGARVVGHVLRPDAGLRARVRVRCPKAATKGCHGKLVLATTRGRTLARGGYRVSAGKEKTLQVHLLRAPGAHVRATTRETDRRGRLKLRRVTLRVTHR